MVLAFYAFMVFDILGYLVPAYVAQAGLRRAMQSKGFNRWLYGYVALVAALALGFLCTLSLDTLVFYLLAQTGTWLTLPLWYLVRVMTPRSRSKGGVDIDHPLPAQSGLPRPLRLQTAWRIAQAPTPQP